MKRESGSVGNEGGSYRPVCVGLVGRGGHPVFGEERVGSVVEHRLGKPFEDWEGLLVQVPRHCVAVPTSQEFNYVYIATTREEGHCSFPFVVVGRLHVSAAFL